MTDSCQLSVNSSGAAVLSGPLTLETVASIYRQSLEAASAGRRILNLDLDAVSRVDSSGLALLLEWQSAADSAGGTLNIRNAPPDLLSLARLCEASDLLILAGRDVPASDKPVAVSSEMGTRP